MHGLRGAVGGWVVWFLAACCVLPAGATSSVPSPTVSAWVSSPYLTRALNIEPSQVGKGAYAFGGAVSWPERDMVYAQGADVYFGVLLPGGTNVRSWAPQNGGVSLVPGFVPFARAISNKTLFQPFAKEGMWPITHVFDGTEPKGLYFVFLLLVSPGDDPNDSRLWREISTQPFVVR